MKRDSRPTAMLLAVILAAAAMSTLGIPALRGELVAVVQEPEAAQAPAADAPAAADASTAPAEPTDAAANASSQTPPAGGPLPDDYSCLTCHKKGGDLWNETTPTVDESHLTNDVHWKKGLRCHDCHGGSETLESFKNHRDDPDFRSLRVRQDSITFCGHCHSNLDYMRKFSPSARTDQETEYWTSGHGQRLKASAAGENAQADAGVATCISCHGGHGILAVKDVNSPVYPTNVAQTCSKCHSDAKLMEGRTYDGRRLGHDQYEQWTKGVHGVAMLSKGDISAPTCNDCHGNHGALPPSVGSVANACGTCHGKVSKLFAETRMKHKFEVAGMPGCAVCHGTHQTFNPGDSMIGMGDGALCAKCHNPANPQLGATLAGADLAKNIHAKLDELKRNIELAGDKVREAERLGMEVRGSRYDLHQAFDALTNARTLIHTFKPGPVDEAVDEGLKVTASVQESAAAALREHTYRRWWLAGSLVPILIVVGLLVATIRRTPLPESRYDPSHH
ncbi:MAG: hypothetical protein DCC68_14925 [Planctomycetota bacterium]|nr:MAG: hypothetical protein DCC68_14925 [Planctomycetota bacterium]